MDIPHEFGALVRVLREAQRLSQEAFAERCHLHRTYVRGIERGERNPSLKNIAALAVALGVSPASFFEWWEAKRDSGADPREPSSAEGFTRVGRGSRLAAWVAASP